MRRLISVGVRVGVLMALAGVACAPPARSANESTAAAPPGDAARDADARRAQGAARRAQYQADRQAEADARASATNDRRAAAAQQRAERDAAFRASEREQRDRSSADVDAFQKDAAALGDSCEDLQQLAERAKAHQTPSAATMYEGAINGRRTARVNALDAKLKNALRAGGSRCDTTEDVAAARGGIADVKEQVTRLRCYDSTLADAYEPKVNAWAKGRESGIADDERCIAQRGCVPRRIAEEDICPELARRRGVEAEIAKTKRYGTESGAVSLTELHDLGEALRTIDEGIAQAKAHYAEIAKAPFNAASCKP